MSDVHEGPGGASSPPGLRVLIVLGAERTGEEPEAAGLIEAYYQFRDAGLDVVVAAAGGGSARVAQGSAPEGTLRRFAADRTARDAMADLVDLATVCAGDFAGALCLGRRNDSIDRLVAALRAAGKPVTAMPSGWNAPGSLLVDSMKPTERKGDVMDKEHVKGAADQAKGAVKEAAGKMTGDKGLEAEGKVDKAKGELHKAAGDVKDAFKK